MADESRKSSASGRKGSAFDKIRRRGSMLGQPVLREGFLEKQSSGLIKQWQRRYFEQVSCEGDGIGILVAA